MTGQEIYNLCKSLADDPDNSFMSQADWAGALQQGYSLYQQYITDRVPEIFERSYNFTITAASEYELDGILFGANPSQGKVAYRITRMHTVNVGSTPDFGLWVVPAGTLEQMWANTGYTGYGNFNPGVWCLQGTKLMFNIQQTNTLRLYYVANGKSLAEWVTAIATAGVFIDNTPDFAQQAIAYFAYSTYAIKDWSDNPTLERKFNRILQQVDSWLTKNRAGDAHRWVKPGRQGGNGGASGGWW
jgi:hypothetical protein